MAFLCVFSHGLVIHPPHQSNSFVNRCSSQNTIITTYNFTLLRPGLVILTPILQVALPQSIVSLFYGTELDNQLATDL